MAVSARALPEKWQAEYVVGGNRGIADTYKQGVGGGAGLRPHELLEAALASCMTITARMELAELGVDDDAGVEVEVEVIRSDDETRFRYSLRLPERLESYRDRLSARLEHSPVRATLSKPITFEDSGPSLQ